jgi:hypothetical protein
MYNQERYGDPFVYVPSHSSCTFFPTHIEIYLASASIDNDFQDVFPNDWVMTAKRNCKAWNVTDYISSEWTYK